MKNLCCFLTFFIAFSCLSQSYGELLNLGNAYFDSKNYIESVKVFSRAIELNPSQPGIYASRAMSLNGAGDYQAAIADFDRSAELGYDHMNIVYAERGVCKQALNDFQGALADFDKGISINPQDAYCWCKRGLLRLQMNDLDAAVADLGKSAEINPAYVTPVINLGVAKYRKGDPKTALEYLNKALLIDSTLPEIYFYRGLAMESLSYTPEEVIMEMDRAIALDPLLAGAFIYRAELKVKTQDYKSAISDYTKAIGIQPGNASIYVFRGLVYIMNLGNAEAAMQDFSKAVETDPANADGYFNLGLVRLYLEQEGCADLQKALQLNHPKAKQVLEEYCK